MAQVGEGVAILVQEMDEDDAKKKCNYKPSDEGWVCKLEGESSTLAKFLGDKPDAISEVELTKYKWPSQAHHLIPHLTLIKHNVSKWLKAGDVLFNDTYYNVDHENNGKWMPYASSLPEWKVGATSAVDKKNNKELMFKVMRLSQIQLHQSKHSSSNRYGIGEAPYKERVIQYLDKIRNNGTSHYVGTRKCEICTEKKQTNKYPARENTVRFVDRASSLIEKDINKCKIFVSRIAAEFQDIEGFDDE